MKTTLISFDWAMKNVLRNKANFDVLSGLLSELLGRKVTVQELLESESNKDDPTDKSDKLDLKAKIDDGEVAIFEIQVGRQGDFFHRILYGTSRAVAEQLHKGDKYGKIKKVYSVDIVYFDLGKGSDYIYHGVTEFKGLHKHDTLMLSDSEKEFLSKSLADGEQSAGVIFPEYYIIYPFHFDGQIKNGLDEWVYVFQRSEVRSEFSAAGIQKAGEALDERRLSDDERIRHEDHIKYLRVKDSEVETAKLDGKREGRAEGLAEGLAEGKREGKIETAKEMILDGMPIEKIAKFTGLTTKEIEKL